MATTTTNFGWDIPQSTDLVKDGATAIAALGQDIDTALVDLKGGTTGQVLAKASNTDLDYTWVAQDDSNAIQNAIVDAKGDLIAASAADTPARLAVGANGETLVADSSTSTGLRYQVPVNVNPVLNSSFQVWQRGTSISYNNQTQYSADRWNASFIQSAASITRQVTGDTTNLPFIQYCARVQRTAGNAQTNEMQFAQSFESINSVAYAGKTVTFSFYARKGANYSTSADALQYRLVTGTGTDQSVLAGFTGANNAILGTATLTTTWQRFTATAALGSTITQIGINFVNTPTGTAGANDYYEITGVQLEVGSVATPFKTYAGTIQGELAACQRYYYRTGAGSANATTYGLGMALSTTNAAIYLQYPVTMRIIPSAIEYADLAISDLVNYTVVLTGLALSDRNNIGGKVSANVASGLTAYRPAFLVNNNNVTGYLGFSAEL